MRKIYTFLLVAAVPTVINAQEVTQDSIRNLDELVISIDKNNSGTSNKMPLKAIENPQVYTVVNKDILEKQMIFSVDDAYRNVTGVQMMWQPTGRAGDGGTFLNMRGFVTSGSLRNGMTGAVTGAVDAANLERLEVLKGPSATLFGGILTSYGGAVNRVTKKPYGAFGGHATLSGGGNEYYRGNVDVNLPLTTDNKWLFRFNTAYLTENSFQDNIFNKQLTVAPVIRFQPNDKLTVDVEMEHFNGKNVGQQVFFFYAPVSAMGIDNMKNMPVDYKQSYIGKDLSQKTRSTNFFGTAEYKFSEKLTSTTFISTSSSYSDGRNPYFHFAVDPVQGGITGINRGDQSTRDSKSNTLEIQQNFNSDFLIGSMRNRLVVGLDYFYKKDNILFYSADIIDTVPLNVPGYDYAAGFNQQTVDDYYRQNPDKVGEYPIHKKVNTYSAYISDVLSLTKQLSLLAALRYDYYDTKSGATGAAATDSFTQGFLSPKFGLVYQILPDQLSAFANYQNSFSNLGYYNSDVNNTPKLAKPEQANQYEIGVKTDLFNGKVSSSLSFYNIYVENTLLNTGVFGPGNTAVQTQAGKLRSRGVDFELHTSPLEGLSFMAGVSYNDSKYIEADADVKDRRPATASSPWLFNFFAGYEFQQQLKGLGIGLSGNYASDNKIQNSQSMGVFILPAYFVLNANIYYNYKQFRFGVKADNLTSEKYWIGYTTASPQKLINVLGTVTYRFNR